MGGQRENAREKQVGSLSDTSKEGIGFLQAKWQKFSRVSHACWCVRRRFCMCVPLTFFYFFSPFLLQLANRGIMP